MIRPLNSRYRERMDLTRRHGRHVYHPTGSGSGGDVGGGEARLGGAILQPADPVRLQMNFANLR